MHDLISKIYEVKEEDEVVVAGELAMAAATLAVFHKSTAPKEQDFFGHLFDIPGLLPNIPMGSHH